MAEREDSGFTTRYGFSTVYADIAGFTTWLRERTVARVTSVIPYWGGVNESGHAISGFLTSVSYPPDLAANEPTMDPESPVFRGGTIDEWIQWTEQSDVSGGAENGTTDARDGTRYGRGNAGGSSSTTPPLAAPEP